MKKQADIKSKLAEGKDVDLACRRERKIVAEVIQAGKEAWMEGEKHCRSKLTQGKGGRQERKGLLYTLTPNSLCSLYGWRNKGNICFKTPNATTVCCCFLHCVCTLQYVFVRVAELVQAFVCVFVFVLLLFTCCKCVNSSLIAIHCGTA